MSVNCAGSPRIAYAVCLADVPICSNDADVRCSAASTCPAPSARSRIVVGLLSATISAR